MSTRWRNAEAKIKFVDREDIFDLPSYPIDMSFFLTLPHWNFDTAGIPYRGNPVVHDPTTITRYALAHWNQYLTTHNAYHQKIFLAQALWLVEHEEHIGDDAGGWPITFPHPKIQTEGRWLSALAQGNGVSVLVRAYQLTHDEVFLEVARRVVRTFECDILDGGVSTPVGSEGIFFEEVAVYPAAHMLDGFVLALFGLYDFVTLTGDTQIEALIHRSLTTMHSLLDEYDFGYWTCPDLLHRCLASSAHLALQAALLEGLAGYTGCEHCKALALRWKGYLNHFGPHLHYLISSCCSLFRHRLWQGVQTVIFPRFHTSPYLRVCVPITGFPVAGGTRAVLAAVDQAMAGSWQIEYLTQHVGSHVEGCSTHRFGTAQMHPWQFPAVWLYVLAGFRKLLSLMHRGANFHVILPQDGVFTAAFAVLAGKLAGVRVVCIDHGNLTLLKNLTYRAERLQALRMKDWSWPRRLLARLQYPGYWPSLSLMARVSARFVDHFLIPGVAGDGVEEACKSLGVQTSRITRFASMIDIDRYVAPDALAKASLREQSGIAADAIVVAMVCRLAPEKGIDIALEAISLALSTLSPAMRTRVCVVIAGDGPLRNHVEADILRRGLGRTFLLGGEASAAEVISLLSLSDIFLYTSTRGACLSMAVLEAMASGCAVLATTLPLANVHMLAEGRGITVPPGDAVETSKALVRLLNDPDLCHRMGKLARDYVAVRHSASEFRRVLRRATYWSAPGADLECREK
jgi:glycosyltransferase involved in cell wall biosynthesis